MTAASTCPRCLKWRTFIVTIYYRTWQITTNVILFIPLRIAMFGYLGKYSVMNYGWAAIRVNFLELKIPNKLDLAQEGYNLCNMQLFHVN